MNAKELKTEISKRITRNPYEAASAFPHKFTVRLPKREELVGNTSVATSDAELRQLSRKHDIELMFASRQLGSSVREFVVGVCVPNIEIALELANADTRKLMMQVDARRRALDEMLQEVGISAETITPEQILKFLKKTHKFTDTDYKLTLQATSFFIRTSDGDYNAGGFPRQIPLPGFSAKWLDKKSRVNAIEILYGRELVLRDRPPQVRYRYLNRPHLPERLATSPDQTQEFDVRLAIITENLDTYLSLPTMEGAIVANGATTTNDATVVESTTSEKGATVTKPKTSNKSAIASKDAIAIFGNGYASSVIPAVMPWLRDKTRTGDIECVYWGDIDADGFEILSNLRTSGLECTSAMMGAEHISRYAHLASTLTEKGEQMFERTPKPRNELKLTDSEYAAYTRVCAGPTFRIEQERIPIDNFMRELKNRLVRKPIQTQM